MNQANRYEDLEFQERVTERRVSGLWGAVGTLIFVVALLVGWNVFLLRGTQRANAGVARAVEEMNSLRAEQRRTAEEAKRLEARIAGLAQVEERLHGTASAGALAALGASVRALEERVGFGEERLDGVMESVRGQSDEISGVNASIETLRGSLAQEAEARTALERSNAENLERMASLDREMLTLRRSYSRAKWYSAASDVLGLVNLGIIVPHVADHNGRP